MLNEGKKPKRWLKPNKNGTGVHFDQLKSQDEYDLGLLELEQYLKTINEQFGLDFNHFCLMLLIWFAITFLEMGSCADEDGLPSVSKKRNNKCKSL